jgi:YidC/Oxa1 family membrane protein insertase
MEKRTVLAIVLSIIVVLVYQFFFMKPPVAQKPVAKQETTAVPASTQPAPAGTTAAAGVKGETTRTKATSPGHAVEAVPDRDIHVETNLYKAVFTTKDGSLKSLKLKNYRKYLAKDSELEELVNTTAAAQKPLTIAFPESSVDVPPGLVYESAVKAIDMTKSNEGRQLTFTQTIKGQIRIEKTFSFSPDKYIIGLDVKVTNLSDDTLTQYASLTWNESFDPKSDKDNAAENGPVYYISKDVERIEAKKVEKPVALGPDVSWAGFESKYFIASLIPQNPSQTSMSITKDVSSTIAVALKGPKNIIPQGQFGLFSYNIYLGPKDYGILKAQNMKLEDSIDFGSWLKYLAIPLLSTVNYINKYVGNYGIAIIILTLIIKIIFWPLGNISYKSMKEMQKLQPQLKELQERYKNDKQKLSQATMTLYKENKVNPFGGCLPMLIQIPVFFGLYKALLFAIELRHAPFFGWIQDLSAQDPYFITPVIMGATMFIQQKMTPSPGDPMQAKIMLWMPVIFTFMFLTFPSGLVIYWLFNNIISIGQQYYINKKA